MARSAGTLVGTLGGTLVGTLGGTLVGTLGGTPGLSYSQNGLEWSRH